MYKLDNNYLSISRTNCLLEKVCEGVSPEHFYACLWDCLASNSGIRLPAISFVLAHFNRRLTMEDQLYIMGTNIDIMVRIIDLSLRVVFHFQNFSTNIKCFVEIF